MKKLFQNKHYFTSIALLIASILVSGIDYAIYDINVELRGGSLPTASVNAFFSPKAFLDHTPTRTGYRFIGWYVNNQTRLENYSSILRQNIDLVARWEIATYQINFQTNGGNSISPIYPNYNASFTFPTPTRSNYLFVGWRTNNSGTGTLYTAGQTYRNLVEDLTFYAYWIEGVTITLNANGGSVSSTQIIGVPGNALTLPTPTRSGYQFDGWFTETTFASNTIFSSNLFPEFNLTLYAKWILAPSNGTSFQQAITMNLSTTYTVNIVSGGQIVYYRFTPTLAGTYVFASTGNRDTVGTLYNSSYGFLTEDDDSGTDSNFRFSRYLNASTTYYLAVKLYVSSSTGSFSISVVR